MSSVSDDNSVRDVKFCCARRTFGLFIGWFGVTLSVIGMVFFLNNTDFNTTDSGCINYLWCPEKSTNTLTIALSLIVLNFMLLLLAIYKNWRRVILIWLVISVIAFVFCVAGMIIEFDMFFTVILVISALLYLGIFWIYYKQPDATRLQDSPLMPFPSEAPLANPVEMDGATSFLIRENLPPASMMFNSKSSTDRRVITVL